MKRIVMIGESPEQVVHGISISNAMVYNIISEQTLWLKEKNVFANDILRRLYKLPGTMFLLYKICSLKKNAFDAFYSSLAVSLAGILKSALFSKLASWRGLSVILHVHRGDFVKRLSDSGFAYRIFAKYLLGIADTLIVLSEAQKRDISEYFSGTIYVLPNTVDTEVAPRTYVEPVSKFLYLSNLIREKGYRDLISVFQSDKLKKLSLTMAGSISTNEDKNFLERHQGQNIIYMGSVFGSKKLSIFANSDCFILPSYNEGQPISILEAISRGMIVVATDVGCIRDMLPDNYPFLFEPGDKAQLSRHIKTISELGVTELNELSCALYNKFTKSFSKAIFENNVLSIFRVHE
jgi:glycosyltransferase involved in cell wall biosynthesis